MFDRGEEYKKGGEGWCLTVFDKTSISFSLSYVFGDDLDLLPKIESIPDQGQDDHHPPSLTIQDVGYHCEIRGRSAGALATKAARALNTIALTSAFLDDSNIDVRLRMS